MASVRKGLQGLVLILSVATAITAGADGHEPVCSTCPAILIDPRAFTEQERRLIREGATSARDFLHAHGVFLQGAIRIDIRDADPGDALPHIGSYSLESKTIKILSLEQSLSQSEEYSLFRLPFDGDMYRSVVAHETAHAIANQNFAMRKPSLVAQEYLAYVVQLATMEPRLRQAVLAGHGLTPYRGVEEMSAIYYQMAPSCFGVKAYLHFLTLDEPGAFIRGLLAGSIEPAGAESE